MTTLSNLDIEKAINSGALLNNIDMNMVEGSCYQLRLGNVYYDLSEGGKRFELEANQSALIKPGHRVVLITKESFQMPDDMVARVVSKGSLFSIGLSPVATYADPGFHGNLGIVTQNMSGKYIELPQEEPIAKAEFTKLKIPSTKPYKGQHGFQMGIWPIKNHLQKEYSEVKKDTRVLSETEEALALLPNATRVIIKRLERTLFWTLFTLIVTVILAISLVALHDANNTLADITLSVATSLIASAVVAIGVLLFNYKRWTH